MCAVSVVIIAVMVNIAMLIVSVIFPGAPNLSPGFITTVNVEASLSVSLSVSLWLARSLSRLSLSLSLSPCL